MEHHNKRKVDCLHLLELKCSQPEDCAKVSTMLQHCLLERRKCKDTIAVLEPLIQFVESEKGRLLLNQLPQVLGKIRKEESRIVERIYSPRAMSYSEYEDALKES